MSRVGLLWLAVPLVGLAELGAHQWLAGRAPSVAEWEALRGEVAALRKEDELVVVAPAWAEPLARHAFGDAMMPLPQVARADTTPFAYAIEVSALGARAPETLGWRVLDEHRSGRFRLRRLENPAPAGVTFDFTAAFSPDRVRVVDAAGQDTCSWNPAAPPVAGGLHGHVAFPAARFVCPGGMFFFVGVTVSEDERYRPHRCVWAHPPEGSPRRIRYRDVPLGERVQGHTGLSWFLMRDGAGTPITLTVRVDGDSLGTVVHRDQEGWRHFALATGRHAGTRAEVEFEIASERAVARHFCFHADSR
ncbi:MAG: hypothetical protein JW751_27940 [Polyangiaceae bacterium]|nr:hypothetical protein [Polyangiaceae bacterium]